MVGPDHHADSGIAEDFCGCTVIGGWHDDDRRTPGPFTSEFQDFIGSGMLAVNQNSVCSCLMIGLRTLQCFTHTPAGNQCFNTCDNTEIRIILAVLSGLDLAAEFIHVSKWLTFTINKTIELGELFIFNADPGDTTLFEFFNEPAHVVEIAITGIAIQQDRNTCDIRHKLQHVYNLGPAGFIAVTYTELRRNGQAAGPYAFKTCFFHQACGNPVMGFHNEFQFWRSQQLSQLHTLAR